MTPPTTPDAIGLYVHVPFCVQKCDYCGFYSVPCDQTLIQAYLERVRRQLAVDVLPWRTRINTVFIGGGNPTAIGPGPLEALCDAVRAVVDEQRIQEWTVETNPETCGPEPVRCLTSLPNLRVSMGVQRLDDQELRALGRVGTVRQARRAIEALLAARARLNLDVILGVPGLPSLAAELAVWIREYDLEHLSTYLLSVEPDTPLAGRVARGEAGDPDDVGPQEWLEVIDTAGGAGLELYEISNSARPGRECRHNLHYWLGGPYLGIGPTAVGTLGDQRVTQPETLAAYLRGDPPHREDLDPEARYQETVMLRLRLVRQGLSSAHVRHCFPTFAERLETGMKPHLAAGRLQLAGETLRLTRAGIPVSNRILADLI